MILRRVTPKGLHYTGMARLRGVSAAALLGTETAKRKTEAVDTRMQRDPQQITNLPPEIFAKLDAQGEPPMSDEEVAEEIAAARREPRERAQRR